MRYGVVLLVFRKLEFFLAAQPGTLERRFIA